MENQSAPLTVSVLRILDSAFFIEEAFNPKHDEVKIGYGIGFYSSVDECSVQFNIKAELTTEEGKLFASNTVSTKFKVVEMKSFFNPDDQVINWPNNSLETMFGIAFSHLRSIMAKNLGASKFKDYIIPLVNPSSLFKILIKDHPDFQTIDINQSEIISEGNKGKTSKPKPKKAFK